ncbi:uncharacterized protein LOC118187653 [Stegodyphus dumicola]|uniref:uncharacterized protein LOC118187653 n=1 Tax=Stegodyphus dumicola TaxID=202533 RepID=UPI0015A77FA2|nr:uncharacterized protein LOC118187653 [Stegodyphus dumicola]
MSRKSTSSQPIQRFSDRNLRSSQRGFGRNPENLHVLVSNEKQSKVWHSEKQESEREKRSRHEEQSNFEGSNLYHWQNLDYVPELNISTPTTVETEEVSDAPFDEGDFEEVEVASDRNASSKASEIPVGFRKSKLKYLRYKCFLFFKPKVYDICPHRTIVNCLNVNENESVEVDVVSEAEAEGETETSKVNFGLEVNGREELFECENLDVKCNTADETNSNQDSFSNAKTLEETDEEKFSTTRLKASNEKSQLVSEGLSREYHTCIPNNDPASGFYQGEAIIQNILNAWTSHLIGLEYLVEIRNSGSNKTSVRNYHCVLCDEDLLKPVSGNNVINHIISNRHMIHYLEKHFPSCGYNFSENVPNNSSEIVLQKCCEEINNKLGYYYMCIADYNYYKTHKLDIKTVLSNAFHADEKNFHLEFKNLESDIISKEVNILVEDIMSKILAFEEESEEEVYEVDDNFDDFVENSPGDEKEIEESNELHLSDFVEDLSDSACESDIPKINEIQSTTSEMEKSESGDKKIHVESNSQSSSKDINSESSKTKQPNSNESDISVNGKGRGKKFFPNRKPRGKFATYLMLQNAISSKGQYTSSAKNSGSSKIKAEPNALSAKNAVASKVKEEQNTSSVKSTVSSKVKEICITSNAESATGSKVKEGLNISSADNLASSKVKEGLDTSNANDTVSPKVEEVHKTLNAKNEAISEVKEVHSTLKSKNAFGSKGKGVYNVLSAKRTGGSVVKGGQNSGSVVKGGQNIFIGSKDKGVHNAVSFRKDLAPLKLSKNKSDNGNAFCETKPFVVSIEKGESHNAAKVSAHAVDECRIVRKISTRNICTVKPSVAESIEKGEGFLSDTGKIVAIGKINEERIVKKVSVRNKNLSKPKPLTKQSNGEKLHPNITEVINVQRTDEGRIVKKISVRSANLSKQKFSVKESIVENENSTNITNLYAQNKDLMVKKINPKTQAIHKRKPSDEETSKETTELPSDTDFANIPTISGGSVVKKSMKIKHRSHVKPGSHSKHCLKRILSKSALPRSVTVASDKKDSKLSITVVNAEQKPDGVKQWEKDGSGSIKRKETKSPDHKKIDKRSKSPVRRIRSPLQNSSPLHLSHSSRRRSISPLKRHSRSPHRRRSPYRKRYESPLRRRSRSPRSRRAESSSRRYSRSPAWDFLRSPNRKRSKSPPRRTSRSPIRRISRSPYRRRSRSPVRRFSRSPRRASSRSSARKYSRSPVRRYSKSPLRRRSRSPIKKRSVSPSRRRRSPYMLPSRSSPRRRSRSVERRNSQSPRRKSYERTFSRSPNHTYGKSSDLRDSLQYDVEKPVSHKSYIPTQKYSRPLKQFEVSSGRAVSDLDPVSDEDESVYFNTGDKNKRGEEMKLPPSTRIALTQMMRKLSGIEVNPEDPSLNKLMHFMNVHSAELQQILGTQPQNIADQNVMPRPVESDIRSRADFLQQCLLSALAGNLRMQQPNQPNFAFPPPVSGIPVPTFSQLPFPPVSGHPVFPPVPNTMPPRIPVQAQQPYPRVQNPGQSFVHPNQFNAFNQSSHSKPNVPSENMFKDLKAKVTKLFGANEAEKIEKEKTIAPHYVTEPDPEKWDLNHPATPKFNPSVSKKVFQPQNKDMSFHATPEPSTRLRDGNAMPFAKGPGRFFSNDNIRPNIQKVPVPPPTAKVAFCDVTRTPSERNLFPVVNNAPGSNFSTPGTQGGVNDVKLSLAQRLASVLVKVGMMDVPAPLLQEMLMKIGAFSSCPPQDISETEIINILRKLGYLS